jgi:trimeric autotransporter adhesin
LNHFFIFFKTYFMLKFKQFFFIFFIGLSTLNAQLSLVKDINSGSGDSPVARRSYVLGNSAYFPADDGVNNKQLWKSDGTSNGTVMLKKINPTGDANAKCFHNVGNTLFFIANDGINGEELWKSDGTEAGTKLVKDITPGSTKTAFYIPFGEEETFVNLNNKLYFIVDDIGLYVSDGTDAGTKLVGNYTGAYSLITHNGKLYFINDNTIYQSDGTSAGTKSLTGGTPRELHSTPLGIFYTEGSALWITDGTSAGTNEVLDASFFSNFDFTKTSVFYKNKFYFILDDDSGAGNQVWSSDGTKTGTKMLKKIATNDFDASFRYFTIANNYLFFLFNDENSSPRELWRTDGTEVGTIKLTTFDGGALNFITKADEPKEYKGKLYFFVEKGNNQSLYTSDGSVAGTKQEILIYDFPTFSQFTIGLLPLADRLLFSAKTLVNSSIGEEIWSYKPVLPPLVASISQTGTLKCNGDKTASLNVTVIGGATPYTYKWNSATISGNNPSNIGAGSYAVTITDGNGSTKSVSLVVTEPSAITITTTTTATASNQNTGTATAVAKGGTTPFSYVWNTTPVQNTAKALNLAKGNYIVTVTDANTCKTTQSVTIAVVSSTNEVAKQLGLSIFPNPASNNITLKMDINEGFEPVSYSILDILGQTVEQNTIQRNNLSIDVSGLANGVYLLRANFDNKIATLSFIVHR